MSASTAVETPAEDDVYQPSPEIVAQANVPDWEASAARARENLTNYWAERARELEWYRPWDKVLDDSNKPFYKWFVGGKVNIVHNCLDRYRQDLAAQQAGADLGGRTRATSAPSPTMPSIAKSANSPVCSRPWAL